MSRPAYHFEWDPAKADQNLSKHKVGFEEAVGVFRDPEALTLYDESHADREERWITLGQDRPGRLEVLVHTFAEVAPDEFRVRVVSARRAKPSGARDLREPTMKDEYDFSRAERGKFFRPDAELHLPVYLDQAIAAYLSERASSKGVELNRLVNDLLKRDIELIESMK